MKKRKWLVLSLALCFAGALAIWYFLPWLEVFRAHFDRIEKGMTQKQVEELMGGAGSRSPPYFQRVGTLLIESPRFSAGWHAFVWRSDNEHIEVIFDREGKVVEKSFNSFANPFAEPSLWARFRQRVGL